MKNPRVISYSVEGLLAPVTPRTKLPTLCDCGRPMENTPVHIGERECCLRCYAMSLEAKLNLARKFIDAHAWDTEQSWCLACLASRKTGSAAAEPHAADCELVAALGKDPSP